MWVTAHWYVAVLKLPPSPASDLLSRRKLMKEVSSEGIQTAPAGIEGSFSDCGGLREGMKQR